MAQRPNVPAAYRPATLKTTAPAAYRPGAPASPLQRRAAAAAKVLSPPPPYRPASRPAGAIQRMELSGGTSGGGHGSGGRGSGRGVVDDSLPPGARSPRHAVQLLDRALQAIDRYFHPYAQGDILAYGGGHHYVPSVETRAQRIAAQLRAGLWIYFGLGDAAELWMRYYWARSLYRLLEMHRQDDTSPEVAAEMRRELDRIEAEMGGDFSHRFVEIKSKGSGGRRDDGKDGGGSSGKRGGGHSGGGDDDLMFNFEV